MSELRRRQARLIKRQIAKIYGRQYIPLITGTNVLSIGDILFSKHDTNPVINSSVFSEESTKFVEGKKANQNITSNSGVNLSTKVSGEATLTEFFNVNEAGLAVQFTSDNQMFLKVTGIREQSIENFVAMRNELLKKYTKGELSSKVYIVRGLVYADKYYLQYSGSSGGSLAFNLDADIPSADADVNADFSFKWKKNVGYHVDGSNGGVLAYRVSGVRLKRHLMPSAIQNQILQGIPEESVLDNLSFEDRKELLENEALEIVDLTAEVLNAQEDYTV